jgi:hypothetical protein
MVIHPIVSLIALFVGLYLIHLIHTLYCRFKICGIRFAEKPIKFLSGEATPSGRSALQIGGLSC